MIYDAQGEEVSGEAGPFLEGYDLFLSCHVSGGKIILFISSLLIFITLRLFPVLKYFVTYINLYVSYNALE
jgi:hypothetical protein